jgi:hypothetical protein
MQAEAQGIQPMFAHLATEIADAVRIAELAVSIWGAVCDALAPIIGQSGVDALIMRCIYLTRTAHPCLQVIGENALSLDGLSALGTVLGQQNRIEAIATNVALLQNFHNVLITLIGEPLANRLLRPVWKTPHAAMPHRQT